MSGPFTAAFQASFDACLANAERLLAHAGDSAGAERLAAAQVLPAVAHPVVAVVGEAKRGKSSLVNMLLRRPELSPVGVVETTATPISFRYGERPTANVHLTGAPDPVQVPVTDLAAWATVAGAEESRRAPTRSVDVELPIESLRSFTLVDTPGLGGLASGVGQLTLRSLDSASVLLFVAEVHTELTSVELEFLRAATERIDTVLIALTSAGDLQEEDLELIIQANRGRLRTAIPRLADVPIFPVDYATAERALRAGDPVSSTARWERSGFAALEQALVDTTARRGWSLLYLSALRLADSLLRATDADLAVRAAALDDPELVQRLEAERERLLERKRTISRVTRAELSVGANNARLEVGQYVARALREVEEAHRSAITERRADLRQLPEQVGADLERVCYDLSVHLTRVADRFARDRLAEVFNPEDLEQITAQLGQRVLLVDGSSRVLTSSQDWLLPAATSVGMGFMAGNATFGAGSMVASAAVPPLVIPVLALTVGAAAVAAMIKLRANTQKRTDALSWLQRTIPDVRNELTSLAVARINEVQSSLSLALEDVLDERVKQLTAQIAQLDRDRKDAADRPAALEAQRAAIAKSLQSVAAHAEKLRATPAVTAAHEKAPRKGVEPAVATGAQDDVHG